MNAAARARWQAQPRVLAREVAGMGADSECRMYGMWALPERQDNSARHLPKQSAECRSLDRTPRSSRTDTAVVEAMNDRHLGEVGDKRVPRRRARAQDRYIEAARERILRQEQAIAYLAKCGHGTALARRRLAALCRALDILLDRHQQADESERSRVAAGRRPT